MLTISGGTPMLLLLLLLRPPVAAGLMLLCVEAGSVRRLTEGLQVQAGATLHIPCTKALTAHTRASLTRRGRDAFEAECQLAVSQRRHKSAIALTPRPKVIATGRTILDTRAPRQRRPKSRGDLPT
jgi:hypothetical protein